MAFAFLAFYHVPVSTYFLAEYLQSVIQIMIVVLGFIITYKVFTVEDSDVKKFTHTNF